MHPTTSPGVDCSVRMQLAERVRVEKHDHDCEGGHGPACLPAEIIDEWFIGGERVTDPALLARLTAQVKEES